jgi:hypothetical protein
MTYRVRSPEGEMDFASLYEVANALRHGLVEDSDELFLPGQSTPVRVGDHPALKRSAQPSGALRPTSMLGGFELGAALASAMVAVTGILGGWNYWVVGGAVLIAAWLSTRIALRASRKKAGAVDSRRR